MFKSISSGRPSLALPDLDLIAKETRLVTRRSSKFSPAGFLQTLLGSVVTGLASFNQLADSLKDFAARPMARQSLHERIDRRAVAFLVKVLNELMTQRFEPAADGLRDGPVRRILVEDASGQVMPKGNAEQFPAHGNHHGATAGVKIDFAFDLLSGATVSHSLHRATEQDKNIGREFVAGVLPGDLVLRDMGYFVLAEFDAIECLRAFWLSRLPLSVDVTLPDGRSLEKLLKGSRRDVIDLRVLAGAVGKKCRLVAVRAHPEVVGQRHANRRAEARKKGAEPSPKALTRDGWHIMLTNLRKDEADWAQLAAVYRARWAVEIQFRAWKQSLSLDKALNRRSNEHHMQALVLAAMIAHQLGMRVAASMTAALGRARLSYEKLYDVLATHLVRARDLDELAAFDPDPRHVRRDKRRRKSPVDSGIKALT
jgi:hypothetical protein